MHDDHALVEARLDRVLRERIRPAIHTVIGALDVAAWHIEGGQGEPVAPAVALGLAAAASGSSPAYAAGEIGMPWGPAWGTTWFHLTGRVPASAAAQRVELLVDLGWQDRAPGFQAEGLAYRPDGSTIKGLHPRNDWVPVADHAAGNEVVDVYVEAAANPFVLDGGSFLPTPLGEKHTAGNEPLYRLVRAEITILETEVWELVADLEVLGGLMVELDLGEPRRWEILRSIERALDAIDLDDVVRTAPDARAELASSLARPASASAHRISAIGHAHIDSAWLWPIRETVRKVARTASNVVQLLDHDPGLVYAMSSAQQFAWLQEHRPEVFARVAEHVRAGRFIPVGGMWVESDTNLPGSEALARQLVHGKRYFVDTFGIDTQEVWLPDSFGYSAALPQLVALSGSRWFLTQKISWNQSNPVPHHTFWWEGLDGTRVFTHFPPVDTYNSELSGSELAHAVRNFRDKGVATRSLVPFGWGDGGGGPTREMLARARRTADLEGSPRVQVESPAAFFEAAEAEYPDAPVWSGELYLELHRGTYTSQAKTKQGNRRSEHLLREAELWCATAAVRGRSAYPYDELDRIWKTVLLHQFHDILPGSSIAWVHREATATYARIGAELEQIITTALDALIDPEACTESGSSGRVTIANAAPQPRNGVPAMSIGRVDIAPIGVSAKPVKGGYVLDNGVVRAVIDSRGLLTSVRDLVADREVLAPGEAGNLLQLHSDLPNRWDAWDVDAFYRRSERDLTDVSSIQLLTADTGERATVRVTRDFGSSSVIQDIELQAGAQRIDCRAEVDWHEREKFLKLAFPLDVHSDRAAYETQFGHLYRPTHENTSWEAARFEVCAHRWVHVGEAGYGVAIVNDSTYGHDVRRAPRLGGHGTCTTVRLSLLRAPRFPDPDADQGVHALRYALVLGAEIADAVREGYAINLPPRTVRRSSVDAIVSVAGSDAVVIEAVKLADDRSGDVIVRLYECLGGRASARVVPGFVAASVLECDLLEREVAPTALIGRDDPADHDGIAVMLHPFQVLTLRLRPSTE